MAEPKKPSSWWQTLPGVLTALAAAVTAITGLVALLFQYGVLGGKAPPGAPPSGVAATPSPNQGATASAALPAPATARAWSDATAVVLHRDGTLTRFRAGSFSNCISVAHDIPLDSGQSVPFERMAGFDVLHADDHASPNAKARLKIELVDGTVLSGTADANCDLFGYNEVGRFSTYYDRIRSVRFER
ncbi:hypothetical protein [Jeongeupia sp. USM3]|uniref:hypothetical protein n=1 Tax=Jeongeupia sp. USM3 TaxID=1906741 RepID=UPI00089DF941|nr:hypothetical protein [Jeongeupia sp. USM3]AOX99665.1 hypothetical protein BJP62_03860 [Jeongeupia sp. USM3]